LLNSQKQEISEVISPDVFQLVYPILIKIFGLEDFVSGDFNKDIHGIADILATKVYRDLFNISTFNSTIPYSFINLITFFSHMNIDDKSGDYDIIGLYKKSPNVFVVASSSMNNEILDNFRNRTIIYDVPLVKIYADDFYPGFNFLSEEEQDQLSCISDDSYNIFITITTDFFIPCTDSLGTYVLVPCFLPNIQAYLYLKYLQLNDAFLALYESKKYELRILSPEEEIRDQYGNSPASKKRNLLGNYHKIHNYITELVDFFSPPS
jgi:hypothetical protein